MKYQELVKFVAQHGNVSVSDKSGNSCTVQDQGADKVDLLENADRYLWDGYWRSRREMEMLVEQSSRGLQPGCGTCDSLEKGLIEAREQDRTELNLDGRHELPALRAFQEHRESHQ